MTTQQKTTYCKDISKRRMKVGGQPSYDTKTYHHARQPTEDEYELLTVL
jgi:hypothetical protein